MWLSGKCESRDRVNEPVKQMIKEKSSYLRCQAAIQPTKHPSKQYTQIAKQSKARKLKVFFLNFYGACPLAGKHAIQRSKAEHATKSSPPIIFMGGPSGPPTKIAGRRAQPSTQARQSSSKPSTYGKQVKPSKKKEAGSKLSKVFRSVPKLTNELSSLASELSQLSWEFELSKAAARQVRITSAGQQANQVKY